MQEWWKKKAWPFIKKYSNYIGALFAGIAGFIFGRKSLSGALRDRDKLRAIIGQLEAESGKLRAEVARLRELGKSDQERVGRLERELAISRNDLQNYRKTINTNRDDLEGLDEGLARLRQALSEHREELEAIQITDHSRDER